MELKRWETPRDYYGYDPVGHYVVLSTGRDAGTVSSCNYNAAVDIIRGAADRALKVGCGSWWKDEEITWNVSAGHWANGWGEYLMVNKDAPQPVIAAAADILTRLEQYPILDEAESAVNEIEAAEARDIRDDIMDQGIEVSGYTYTSETVEALCREVGWDFNKLGTSQPDWDEIREELTQNIEDMLAMRPVQDRLLRELRGQLTIV